MDTFNKDMAVLVPSPETLWLLKGIYSILEKAWSTEISLLPQLILSFFLKSETSTQKKKAYFIIFYFGDVLY